MYRCKVASEPYSARLALHKNKLNRGFTLVELAVVMVIFTLLLGMMLVPLGAQQDMQYRMDTQRTLDDLREALLGYALINGRLPCPAVSAANGEEDRSPSSTTCNKHYGFIPWVSLGAAHGTDAWGRLIGYSVSPRYADAVFNLSVKNDGAITLVTRSSAHDLVRLSNKDDIPAVLFSAGKNGCGATVADAAAVSAQVSCAAHMDEEINAGTHALAKGNSTFNSKTYADVGHLFVYREPGFDSNGGDYDDMVSWLSPFVLFSRMVSAGRLP